jgi:hypothetical protein
VGEFMLALKFLAEHPHLRNEMGARGRAFVEKNFSRERLLRDVAELYRELSGRGWAGRNSPFQSQPADEDQTVQISHLP